jgi:hypothetical protein
MRSLPRASGSQWCVEADVSYGRSEVTFIAVARAGRGRSQRFLGRAQQLCFDPRQQQQPAAGAALRPPLSRAPHATDTVCPAPGARSGFGAPVTAGRASATNQSDGAPSLPSRALSPTRCADVRRPASRASGRAALHHPPRTSGENRLGCVVWSGDYLLRDDHPGANRFRQGANVPGFCCARAS